MRNRLERQIGCGRTFRHDKLFYLEIFTNVRCDLYVEMCGPYNYREAIAVIISLYYRIYSIVTVTLARITTPLSRAWQFEPRRDLHEGGLFKMDTECSERVSNPISIVDRERSLGVMYSVLIVNARDSRYSALFTPYMCTAKLDGIPHQRCRLWPNSETDLTLTGDQRWSFHLVRNTSIIRCFSGQDGRRSRDCF